MKKQEKPTCGLCGKTENLTKTECCGNWICDDAHEYKLFSFDTNSCYRNHDRYTLCAYHFHEEHSGKWQDCELCKKEFGLESYVDLATNDFNFEKLKNPPKVTIKCIHCGFTSHSMQDFSYQTAEGFYCNKPKCQKVACPF